MLVGYRTGDVWSPHLDPSEPLQTMVRHFAECIREGKAPLTDGEAGLRVVRILEAAQRSIKRRRAGRSRVACRIYVAAYPPAAKRRDLSILDFGYVARRTSIRAEC